MLINDNSQGRRFCFGWLSEYGRKPVLVPKYASMQDDDFVYINHLTEEFVSPIDGAKYVGLIVNEPQYQRERPRSKGIIFTGSEGPVGKY